MCSLNYLRMRGECFNLEFNEYAFPLTNGRRCLTGIETESDTAFDHNRIHMKAGNRFAKKEGMLFE